MRQLAVLCLLVACGGGEFDSRTLAEAGGTAGSGGAETPDANAESGAGEGGASTGGQPGNVEPLCQTLDRCAEPCDGGECITGVCRSPDEACRSIKQFSEPRCVGPDGSVGSVMYACLPKCTPSDPELWRTCSSGRCIEEGYPPTGSVESYVCVPEGWE